MKCKTQLKNLDQNGHRTQITSRDQENRSLPTVFSEWANGCHQRVYLLFYSFNKDNLHHVDHMQNEMLCKYSFKSLASNLMSTIKLSRTNIIH